MGCEGGPSFRSPEILENLAEKRPELAPDDTLGLCQLRELVDGEALGDLSTDLRRAFQASIVGLADDDMVVADCRKNGCEARCLVNIEAGMNEDGNIIRFGGRRGGKDPLSDCVMQ